MAGQSAAKTMSEVARSGAARKGIEIPEEQLAAQEAAIQAHFDAQEDAFIPRVGCWIMASSTPGIPARCWPSAWRRLERARAP